MTRHGAARRRRAALCALAALLVPTGSRAADAFSDGVVKIGVLGDRSSVYADMSGAGSEVAARMAAEESAALLPGVTIQVVGADHQNKPDIASNLARRWFDVDKVDMITDLGNSSVALAVQSLARQANRLNIVVGGGTTRLTGADCSPNGFQWAWDTHALAVGTGTAMTEAGGKSWFFITADYAFGQSLEKDTAAVVARLGGKVAGSVRHPLNTADFASYLLQAQSSGASVVALANGGTDFTNALKQAAEFGLGEGGQRLAGLLVFETDIDAIGLKTAQGLVFATGFYWDLNEETRAFSARFRARHGAPPTMIQAGVYSATLQYLKAVAAAGTDEPKRVAEKLRELPVRDAFAGDGRVLANGRMVYDWHLMQVKTPAESKGRWDYYKALRTIPGTVAFQTVEASGCKLAP